MPNNFKNGQLEETIATSFVSDKALSPTVVARRVSDQILDSKPVRARISDETQKTFKHTFLPLQLLRSLCQIPGLPFASYRPWRSMPDFQFGHCDPFPLLGPSYSSDKCLSTLYNARTIHHSEYST
jgi:hypothetical protein